MWKSKIVYLLGVVALLIGDFELGMAQDPHFTQFYANPLYLNPAFAGSRKCPRATLNYRNQWPQAGGQFVTYSASYDQHVDGLNGGLGGLIYQDYSGDGTLKTLNISAIYSYTLPVTRELSVKFGLEASYKQKSIDWSRLTFGDMIDPRYGFIYDTQESPGSDVVNMADFSTGILAYTKVYYLGVAFHHLTQPNESFFADATPYYRKFTAHAGAIYNFKERDPEFGSISPNILVKSQGANMFNFEESASQVNVGLYLKRGPFVGGLWYRFGDSFIALVGLQNDNFRFGYSYDLTTSALTNEPGGSHEISMAFLFDCKPKRRVYRPLACPEF